MDPSFSVDRDALAAWLEESRERIAALVDPAHHTLLELYLRRADVLHTLQREPADVVLELGRAARCYASYGGMFLQRWPYSRLRQRRMLPLELALISREPDVMGPIAQSMGAPTMALLAGLEDEELSIEIRAVTGGVLHDVPRSPAAAMGALALLYWACLSALCTSDGAGFDAARLQACAVVDAVEIPCEGAGARMRAVHEALGALKPRDPAAFDQALAAHLKATMTERPEALDHTVLALGCVAVAAGLTPTLPDASEAMAARHLAYVAALVSDGEVS